MIFSPVLRLSVNPNGLGVSPPSCNWQMGQSHTFFAAGLPSGAMDLIWIPNWVHSVNTLPVTAPLLLMLFAAKELLIGIKVCKTSAKRAKRNAQARNVCLNGFAFADGMLLAVK